MASSLLKMTANNIAQIAYHNACRYSVSRVYFGGSFIRNNPITMARISYGLEYWSKGSTSAHFLLHEGFLGTLGALLKNDDIVLKLR